METHSKPDLLQCFTLEAENRTSILSDLFELIEEDKFNIFSHINYDAEPQINKSLSHLIVSVKDNIMLNGMPFNAGSGLLDSFLSNYSATAVSNLLDEGITIIGKTNLDEFAIGTLGTSSALGNILNPLYPEYMIGGSSAGAAASVATDICHIAIASDTGGSSRIPAAMTGLLGFKPSYGSVSRYGLLSFAPGYDQVSFISKNIEYIKETYLVARGKDTKDMTSLTHKDIEFRGHTIGVLNLDNAPLVSQEVIDNYNSYIDYLMDLGFMISEITIPDLEQIIAAYQVLTSIESSSNLSRFTGTSYGKRIEDTINTRSKLIGEQTKNRIILGNYLLSHDKEKLIEKAESLKQDLIEIFIKMFTEVDVVITPTTPLVPAKVDKKNDNQHHFDAFTCISNIIASPTIVFPYGEYKCGLPQSIQIISPQYTDIRLLDFYKELTA